MTTVLSQLRVLGAVLLHFNNINNLVNKITEFINKSGYNMI